MDLVFLGLPRYDDPCLGTMKAFYGRPGRQCRMMPVEATGSLLCQNFNMLWASALDCLEQGDPITHFAMLHADVVPCPLWVDILLDELKEQNADILSAVIPLKDGRGLTSTGIGRLDDPWRPLFRLSMTQVMDLPETFTAADCGHPDKPLLVNTGCWICRFDPAWVYEHTFHIQDRITRNALGRWAAQVEPEDWAFSRWAHTRGLKVMATRKLGVEHMGKAAFSNQKAWGDWSFDQDHDGEEFRPSCQARK